MMADRRGTLEIFYNVLLLILFIYCIKVNKPRYLTSDGISITFNINGFLILLLKVIPQVRCLYSNRTESFYVLIAEKRVFNFVVIIV